MNTYEITLTIRKTMETKMYDEKYVPMLWPWNYIGDVNEVWTSKAAMRHLDTLRQMCRTDETLALEKYFKEDFVKNCREKWALYKDLLRDCTIYDDEYMDSCESWEVWSYVMQRAKEKKLKLKGREHGSIKMRETKDIFAEFSMDTLKELYSRETICMITQFFIDEIGKRNYDGHQIIDKDSGMEYTYFSLMQMNAEARQCDGKERNPTAERKNDTRIDAAKLIQMLLKDENIGNDGYDFVIQHLQFATLEDLKKLMKLSKTKFEERKANRPRNDLKIFKYDKEFNLITVFENRAQCMKRDIISKSALANVLSGKRKTFKGYIYVEDKYDTPIE